MIDERSTNWTIVPCPHPRLGDARLPRARRRRGLRAALAASSGTSCGSTSPTRRRPGSERIATLKASAGRSTRARFDALELARPRHRADGRAPPGVELAGGRRRDARRASATCRTCRPRRCSRPPTRCGPTGTSPRPGRSSSGTGLIVRGLRVALRGGPRGRGRRRRERRGAQRVKTDARRRAPPGSARSRSSTGTAGSGRSGRSSTTRCSTRTPRATSRSGTASPRARGPDGGERIEPERDPHRLHDRLARARGDRDSPRRRRDACPSSRGGDWQL